MPDDPRPSTAADAQASPGEFDFAASKAENPRMKRRSLKVQSAAASPAAPDGTSPASALPAAAQPVKGTASAFTPATPMKVLHPLTSAPKTEPSSSTRPQSNPPLNTNPSPSANAHPSTLYYSGGARPEKEDAPSMKSTPSAANSSSSSAAAAKPSPSPSAAASPAKTFPTSTAPSAGSARPATAATTNTAAAPARNAAPVDYRANIDRQVREQKSAGGILEIIVYVLIGLFVTGAALAGYGTYVLFKQVHQQSATMADLDARYAARNVEIMSEIKTSSDALIQTQAHVDREQDLINRQQDAISKLTASNDKLVAASQKLMETTDKLIGSTEATEAALRQERQARAYETSNLRGRVRALENPAHPGL